MLQSLFPQACWENKPQWGLEACLMMLLVVWYNVLEERRVPLIFSPDLSTPLGFLQSKELLSSTTERSADAAAAFWPPPGVRLRQKLWQPPQLWCKWEHVLDWVGSSLSIMIFMVLSGFRIRKRNLVADKMVPKQYPLLKLPNVNKQFSVQDELEIGRKPLFYSFQNW